MHGRLGSPNGKDSCRRILQRDERKNDETILTEVGVVAQRARRSRSDPAKIPQLAILPRIFDWNASMISA